MAYGRSTKSLPSRERLLEAAKALFAERGYEATSTASISRRAGTSESQLIKHFGSKQGILTAIFEYAWGQINPALRLATASMPSPREKLRIIIEMVLNFLARDSHMLKLFLLEGRRIRDDGKLIVLVPGFLEFVKITDEMLEQMYEEGEMNPKIHPQALRSGLMGAIEGLLRDRILAATSNFPATYSESEIRAVCFRFLEASLVPVKT